MLRVFGLGRGGGGIGDSGEGGAGDDKGGYGRQTSKEPRELRIQKELNELELPVACVVSFPDSNDVCTLNVAVTPDEGFWCRATFNFNVVIPYNYPHQPPKVKCSTKVYHPNIDMDGNVCLNILREDWRPVLTISTVILGILHLFLEPNSNDPLNKEAAQMLRRDRNEFGRYVLRTLRGGVVGQTRYPLLL